MFDALLNILEAKNLAEIITYNTNKVNIVGDLIDKDKFPKKTKNIDSKSVY